MPSPNAPRRAKKASDEPPSPAKTKRGRAGGRSARAAQARQAEVSAGQAFTRPRRNRLGGVELINAEALEQIHQASLHILENFGIEFMAADARADFVRAGALSNEETGRVRIGRDLVEAALATCPTLFRTDPPQPGAQAAAG